MGSIKKSVLINRPQLVGSYKKSGVDIWRYSFAGSETGTGAERRFFIEFEMLNPYLSPAESKLGYQSRVNISAEDLQNVLAGTASAQNLRSETFVVPSYCVVRAGIYDVKPRQICEYFATKEVAFNTNLFNVDVGHCSFSDEKLSGFLDCPLSEIHEHPEYLCDAGSVSWELRYDFKKEYSKGYFQRPDGWYTSVCNAVFAGTITFDGKEYTVNPKKCAGYVDRLWGKTYPDPYFHVSCSNLTSMITGQLMAKSGFAVQGAFADRVSLSMRIGEKELTFCADEPKRSYQAIWECSQMPEDENGERLHWSVSITNKKFVIDIDVFCPASQLYVRSWELPEGKRKILKVIGGGSGTGEVRLYKKIKKNLELIEHAHVAMALCQFGKTEDPEQ